MKLYFTARQIPELQGLSMPERMEKLRQAENRLTAPEKLLLNVCKLLVIVPVFVFILRAAQDWSSLLWAGLFILAYPFLLKPFQYSMSAKYLSKQNSNQGEQ